MAKLKSDSLLGMYYSFCRWQRRPCRFAPRRAGSDAGVASTSRRPQDGAQPACAPPVSSGLRPATAGLAFSLIELVVVMLLVAILAVAAVEKIFAVASIRDRLAANELRVSLRHIRALAVTRECATRVAFDLGANSYAVSIANTNGVFAAAPDPVTRAPWAVSVGQRFPGVAFSAVSNIPGNQLYFSGTNGVPCSATNVPLTTDGTVTFASGLTVTIVKETGYVY